MTLLEMTQNILSAMNSDDVNSITDTVESQQVAEEIRTTFRELYNNHDMGSFEGVINLQSPSDITRATTLLLPSNVQFVKWIKYIDFRTGSGDDNLVFKDVEYVEPEDFILRIVNGPDPVNSVDVHLVTGNPGMYTVASDKAPSFYTIFQDSQELVFDSFDQLHESFLTSSSSLAWGTLYQTFELNDSFVPPIPASEFPHLLAEAKAACFINIKEIANSFEEARSRRQLVRSQRRPATVAGQKKGVLTHVDYSRKR
jgi:hypothetical protein